MTIRADSLQVVGAIDDLQALSIEEIEAAAQSPQALARGTAFTGRNTTRVFANAHTVVKLRGELHFNERDSLRWVNQALERERALGVHHPAKTWFVYATPDGTQIGNATPRLIPLHEDAGLDQSTRFDALEQLLNLYFTTAVQHDYRLDEGLSNFGLDESSGIYYLDDDLYAWDDYTAFVAGLGSWLRTNPTWCVSDKCQHLGKWVRDSVLDAWDDRHQLHVLAGQLRQVFMADAAGKAALDHIRDSLLTRDLAPIQTQSSAAAKAWTTQFALLADVHANFPALQAVLNDLDARGIQDVLVLGDVVGYGPHPRECIAMLRERGFVVIQGNHDYGVATGNTQRGFSKLARSVVEWTRERLNADELQWLATLPPFFRHDDWLAVHGAPIDKQFFYGYVYHMTYTDNLNWLAREGLRLAFHGHTHLAGAYVRRDGKDLHWTGERLSLADAEQTLLCPGSVGQPRGGRAGAEYAVVDRVSGVVDYISLDYDCEITVRDMSAAGLPSEFIGRLRVGK